jgi:hypothetical protein
MYMYPYHVAYLTYQVATTEWNYKECLRFTAN